MGGFDDHAPVPKELEHAATVSRNARLGLILFFVYTAIYAGFVLLNAFDPEMMDRIPALGLNLAILYGLGLIAGAILLAFVYAFLCRSNAPDAPLPGDRRP